MKEKLQVLGSILLLLFSSVSISAGKTYCVDILVVGGGASGVTAALQSARMGMHVLVIEETPWLGGMLTSAGVSAVDGNYRLPAGIWGEFRERLVQYYGGVDSLGTGWVSKVLFEPSVGNRIFHEMLHKEKNITIWKESSVKQICRKKGKWFLKVFTKDRGIEKVEAGIVIDATELGDVAQQCGVEYDIGMESRRNTYEDIAPESANNIVQDLTYVAILKDYGRDVTIPRPRGYRPEAFACACVNLLCITPKEPTRVWSKDKMITYGRLPHGKYMINWPIEGNDYYVNLIEMSPQERIKALKAAKMHTLCFIYFIQHELGYNHLGLADDEYPTKDLLPFIPYHRESRRIHGQTRFTLNHVTQPYSQPEPLYRTCIAVGDYPVDHHHTRYQGSEELPDLHFHTIPSFGVPLGTMIPKNTEGLIVAEKSISVSNIINGSTRLQPVVMQIGQAAGTLASLAIKQGKQINEVAVRDVQDEVLKARGYLLPYLDVAVEDPKFIPYQHIGSTGILRGVGKSVDWSNETWLRGDTVLIGTDLMGLYDVYPHWKQTGKVLSDKTMTVGEALSLINDIARAEHIFITANLNIVYEKFNLWDMDENQPISRGEMAILIDQMLDPFHGKKIDIHGRYVE